LRGSVVLDTSAIIEYMMGTELGRIVKEYFETLKPEEKICCSLYAISEIFYVLCRVRGSDYALEKIASMLNSRVIEINNSEEVALKTGMLKCERAISIGDCSCIATAKITGSRAVFARKEKEIVDEMRRKPFAVELLFLADSNRIDR